MTDDGAADAAELLGRLRELEARLRAAEERAALYEAFYDNLPVPAAVHREDGLCVEVNRKNIALVGLSSKDQLVGKHNMYEDPEAKARGYAAHMERAIRTGELVQMAPTSYDTAAGGIGPTDDRRIWTQTSYQPVEVGGTRYAVQTNLDVTERMQALEALADNTTLLEGVIGNAPVLVYVKDIEGRYLLVNDAALRLFALQRDQLIGRTDHDIFPHEHADVYVASDREVLASQVPRTSEDELLVNGRTHHYVTTKFPVYHSNGKVRAVCCISVDITARKEAEAAASKLQEEMIHLQEATLRALSSPLLPIAKGVVVMPLIGNIDGRRAQQVLDTLLSGIVAHQASTVIMDVTGVPMVDTHVANALLHAAQAVKLLGAHVILTGIQPATARTLVDLDANLGGISTRATLESGIAEALGRIARVRGR